MVESWTQSGRPAPASPEETHRSRFGSRLRFRARFGSRFRSRLRFRAMSKARFRSRSRFRSRFSH